MAYEVSISGLDVLTSRLTKIAEQFGGPRAAVALKAEAEIEMTEAKRRTPVRTGVLKASGHVIGPTWTGGGVVHVRLTFGGAASAYAIAVHENLAMLHRHGQAKFLESVILESAVYLPQRIANRLRAGAGTDFAPSRGEVARASQAVAELESELSG